jgi:hypothetical protein
MWLGSEYVRVVFEQLAAYLIHYANTGSLTEAADRVQPWRPAH